MEYEFEIRQEILAGRYDGNARNHTDRRNTDGEDQRRGMGTPQKNGRRYGSTDTVYDEGAQGHVHDESVASNENGNTFEESNRPNEQANKGSERGHNGEPKTGWESERESYFSARKMGEAPKRTVANSTPVRSRAVGSRLALGGLAGLASLTDNDDNKTAEEIEAEERARLAGENVAGVLEIARLVAEAVTNYGDISDDPLEEPVLKM